MSPLRQCRRDSLSTLTEYPNPRGSIERAVSGLVEVHMKKSGSDSRKRRRPTCPFSSKFCGGKVSSLHRALLSFLVTMLVSLSRPCRSWMPGNFGRTGRQQPILRSQTFWRTWPKLTPSAYRICRQGSSLGQGRPGLYSSLKPPDNSSATSASNNGQEDSSHPHGSVVDENGSPRSARRWKEHPALNSDYELETWIVPKQHCHAVLCEPQLQIYLASRFFDSLPLSQRTPKLVRPHNDTHQLVLRNNISGNSREKGDPTAIERWLLAHAVQEGPRYTVHLQPQHLTTSHIFATLGIPPLTSFEQVGNVIHLNLKDHHIPHRHVIGEILLECLKPAVRTVINKVGEVQGDFRTYDMEVLAGENSTKVKVNERGASLQFDMSKVYWSSRLAGEREVIMSEILRDSATSNETVVIADAFSGVGALCVLLAQTNLVKNAMAPQIKILANDWNPDAVDALQKNAKQNRVSKFIDARCGDAYDFMMDLGMASKQLPHHVILNYPLEAPTFLNVLRWWKVPKRKSDVVPRIHVYTFARREGKQTAADVAVDEVAHRLLPEANQPTPNRLEYLQSLDCRVRVREVRDVAPGKLVMCVSFRATALLLRHVQGDFV